MGLKGDDSGHLGVYRMGPLMDLVPQPLLGQHLGHRVAGAE